MGGSGRPGIGLAGGALWEPEEPGGPGPGRSLHSPARTKADNADRSAGVRVVRAWCLASYEETSTDVEKPDARLVASTPQDPSNPHARYHARRFSFRPSIDGNVLFHLGSRNAIYSLA